MNPVECRFCRSVSGEIVLDLGRQPACDHFPEVTDTGPDPVYPLRMWLCDRCGLAQLAEDPTTPEEPRGVEPQALVDQARDAVSRVSGLLPPSGTVTEFGSPHGGSWLGLLPGFTAVEGPADVVVDCFGLMHEADQAKGLAERVERLAPGGVLLLQYHSLATILRCGQWNALRHGHYAYYSTPVLTEMLRSAGLVARTAFRFDLYGGTVLLAASREGTPDETITLLSEEERAAGVTDPAVVAGLERAATRSAAELHDWLVEHRASGARIGGYGAASRAVALLCRAGVDADLLPVVADAGTSKQGRRMPGTSIPVVAPEELLANDPASVVLFVPDLLPEVRRSFPQLEAAGGRWVVMS